MTIPSINQKEHKGYSSVSAINLRKLEFFPDANPLVLRGVVPLKTAHVYSGLTDTPLVNSLTGELVATSVIHQTKRVDPERFVKLFIKGVLAAHELSRSAAKVFFFILELYEDEPLDKRGYNDSIYLAVVGNKIAGRELPFSKQLWTRGFKELLFKHFLAPKTPHVYWVNPSLFFKGDRALLILDLQKLPREKNNEQLTQTKEIAN